MTLIYSSLFVIRLGLIEGFPARTQVGFQGSINVVKVSKITKVEMAGMVHRQVSHRDSIFTSIPSLYILLNSSDSSHEHLPFRDATK
uniref:Tick transposon n=1 Tax=Rhipicephalus appendiculatus TaxID=34631 RepID=A0A131YGQ1_RHIAP